MKIVYDPVKRETTLRERGLDFEDAPKVFSGPEYTFEDDRQVYGETRQVTVGFLGDRMVIVIWTERGRSRRIISMRKANAREQKNYGSHFPQAET
jgi:uncharacterized protein